MTTAKVPNAELYSSRAGTLGDIIVGVVGALIGGFLFRLLGLTAGGLIGSLVTATIGAVALIFVLRMLKRAP